MFQYLPLVRTWVRRSDSDPAWLDGSDTVLQSHLVMVQETIAGIIGEWKDSNGVSHFSVFLDGYKYGWNELQMHYSMNTQTAYGVDQ